MTNPTESKQEPTHLEDVATTNQVAMLSGARDHFLDASMIEKASCAHELKTASDGKTVLIPRPSDDPADPLNWSQLRKCLVLLVISCTAFLPDYGSGTGAVTLIPQAKEWGLSEDTVNHSQVGNVFMLGAGGLVVTILASYFGRLPTLFWFLPYDKRVVRSYYLEPVLGPLIAAFIINTTKWQWAFGIYTIETGLCILMTVLFVDETFYNRDLGAAQQPMKGSRVLRLVGIEQFRSRHLRQTLATAVMRPLKIISKPTVFLSSIYYCFTLAWAVGINTTLSIFLGPLYGFGLKQIGFFYFSPVIAALIGELVGHWLHDAAAKYYMQRHRGQFEPEARLQVIWCATPFMITGLALFGFCLERKYHYMVTAIAWGLYVFGVMIATVGINAYNLDSYPEASGEVTAWINMARTTGGFIVSYFQVKWAQSVGTEVSFGTQAGIVGAMFSLVVIMQLWGKKMRDWARD
ncbi:Major Facilitator Superfamily protein [Penicillium daleae]|uniref:Major Facilitator Superfamily protein n=1 Tax=Penicillium daleae TaxID=63821 RepID=A0AAD6CJV9_9EURO|nr:Major Facilitator Superfamily protein [Penicillium daleae]KAJ5465294.1 Major Facilitator Superfamily protein [Penicillium daleae]